MQVTQNLHARRIAPQSIPTPTPTIVPTPTPTSVPVVTDPPVEDKSGNTSMMGIALIGLVALGAGGFWFVKNRNAGGKRTPVEPEYDEEEDDEILEDSEEDIGT